MTRSIDFNDPTIPLKRDSKGSLKSYGIKQLKTRYEAIKKDEAFQDYSTYLKCEPEYRELFPCWKRTLGITVSIPVALALIALFGTLALGILQAGLGDLPSLHVFTQLNPITMSLCAATVILFTGAFIVIHRARTRKEESLAECEWKVIYEEAGFEKTKVFSDVSEAPSPSDSLRILSVEKLKKNDAQAPERGAFFLVADHIQTCRVHYLNKDGRDCYWHGYLDTSTLDENGDGKCYIYHTKGCFDHYGVSTEVAFFGTPVYLVGTIVYNIFRLAVIPFYILFQIARELKNGKNPNSKRKFSLLDIPKQMALSVGRIVQAPFYALAYFLAGLYSLVNPMGGRKLGSAIERDWNGGVHLVEGFWSTFGWQKYGKWEFASADPDKFGQPFYLAGCWQPFGIVEFKNHEMIEAYWIAKDVNPTGGTFYDDVYIRSKFKEPTEQMLTMVEEYKVIRTELAERHAL